VTRDDFIAGLTSLGSVECRSQPDGQVLAVLEPQPVPGTGRTSRVAFLLPDVVISRPTTYMDGDLRTRTGGLPNNFTTTVFGRDVFGTWSFNCPWDPASDSAEALALAALAQWNR
jgi:hypothetical protein